VTGAARARIAATATPAARTLSPQRLVEEKSTAPYKKITRRCRFRVVSLVAVLEHPEGGPMKYLSFIRSSEKFRKTPPPAALMEAMGDFVTRSKRDGTLVDTGGLLPSDQGFRIRLEAGEIHAMDGPFSETKEVIGGWAVLEAKSREDALRIATEFMELHRKHWPGFEGESEVRPIFDHGVGA
jgi:hypothetical protein